MMSQNEQSAVSMIHPRILVVDDERVVCRVVTRILVRDGYRVDSAFTAAEGLHMMMFQPYDLVITDLMMPGMSGMEFLEELHRRWPELLVIVITAYGSRANELRVIKQGAFDFVRKPFTPVELSSIITRAFARRRLRATVVEPVSVQRHGDAQSGVPRSHAVLYTIPDHAWVRVEFDGRVRIGLDDIFQQTVGTIVNIDLPFEGDRVEQGTDCVRITSQGMQFHNFWSPVSGEIILVNRALNRNASLANHDPYGKGWLFLVAPTNLENDLRNLVPAVGADGSGSSSDSTYQRHNTNGHRGEGGYDGKDSGSR